MEGANLFRHRHMAAAEALEKHWLEWLKEGLRRTSPRTLEAHDSDPVQTLRALSGRAPLHLDEALRNNSALGQTSPLSPSPRSNSGDRTLADAYLFVAACNPNGFVRERALIAFDRYPGPLALAPDSFGRRIGFPR